MMSVYIVTQEIEFLVVSVLRVADALFSSPVRLTVPWALIRQKFCGISDQVRGLEIRFSGQARTWQLCPDGSKACESNFAGGRSTL